jgi:hypothetical protein
MRRGDFEVRSIFFVIPAKAGIPLFLMCLLNLKFASGVIRISGELQVRHTMTVDGPARRV